MIHAYLPYIAIFYFRVYDGLLARNCLTDSNLLDITSPASVTYYVANFDGRMMQIYSRFNLWLNRHIKNSPNCRACNIFNFTYFSQRVCL